LSVIFRYDLNDVELAVPLANGTVYADFTNQGWQVEEFRLTPTESMLVILLSRDTGNGTRTWTVQLYATVKSVFGSPPALFFDLGVNNTVPAFSYAANAKLRLAIGQFQFPAFVNSSTFPKNLGEVIPYTQLDTVVRYEGTVPDFRLIPRVITSAGRIKLALAHNLMAFGVIREVFAPLLTPRTFLPNTLVWTAVINESAPLYSTNFTSYINVTSGVAVTRFTVLTRFPFGSSPYPTMEYTYEVESWPFKDILSQLEFVTVVTPQSWSARNYTVNGELEFYSYSNTVVPTYSLKATNGGPTTTLVVPRSAQVWNAGSQWKLPEQSSMWRDGSNLNLAVDVPAFPGRMQTQTQANLVVAFTAPLPVYVYYWGAVIAVLVVFVLSITAFVIFNEVYLKRRRNRL